MAGKPARMSRPRQFDAYGDMTMRFFGHLHKLKSLAIVGIA